MPFQEYAAEPSVEIENVREGELLPEVSLGELLTSCSVSRFVRQTTRRSDMPGLLCHTSEWHPGDGMHVRRWTRAFV